MNNVNVGVIGLGRLGALYASYIAVRIPHAKLLAVCDARQSTATAVAAENEVRKNYSDYHDLIADKEIDLVVITTPTDSHKEIAIAAANAGKAIFCEKPLALSLEDASAMREVVDRTGVFFHLGFMRRFDPGYAAAKRQIDEGTIGVPIVFKSS